MSPGETARTLFSLSPAEAESAVEALGGRAFHARIARREACERGVLDYAAMSGLPAGLRVLTPADDMTRVRARQDRIAAERFRLAAQDVQRDPIGGKDRKGIVGRVGNRLVDQLATGLEPLAGLVGLAQVEFAHRQD